MVRKSWGTNFSMLGPLPNLHCLLKLDSQFLFAGSLALPTLFVGFLFENLYEGAAQLAWSVKIGEPIFQCWGPCPTCIAC
ncbi:hypothetical protein SA9_00745 [Staphylococcus warneri]|nr:pathogenicity island protein [Staphylococcus warneri SG1]KTW20288.1 hypothetical protein SA9_00745 [Staphylococcus warneri]